MAYIGKAQKKKAPKKSGRNSSRATKSKSTAAATATARETGVPGKENAIAEEARRRTDDLYAVLNSEERIRKESTEPLSEDVSASNSPVKQPSRRVSVEPDAVPGQHDIVPMLSTAQNGMHNVVNDQIDFTGFGVGTSIPQLSSPAIVNHGGVGFHQFSHLPSFGIGLPMQQTIPTATGMTIGYAPQFASALPTNNIAQNFNFAQGLNELRDLNIASLGVNGKVKINKSPWSKAYVQEQSRMIELVCSFLRRLFF